MPMAITGSVTLIIVYIQRKNYLIKRVTLSKFVNRIAQRTKSPKCPVHVHNVT